MTKTGSQLANLAWWALTARDCACFGSQHHIGPLPEACRHLLPPISSHLPSKLTLPAVLVTDLLQEPVKLLTASGASEGIKMTMVPPCGTAGGQGECGSWPDYLRPRSLPVVQPCCLVPVCKCLYSSVVKMRLCSPGRGHVQVSQPASASLF